MKKLKFKLLSLFASSIFLMAIQSVNMASRNHTYQGTEPDVLKKYRK